MIPAFPRFAPIIKSHKSLVDLITRRYDPYSDFNFVSLFGWNTDGKTELSILNNNLIIKLKNYTKEGVVYSILGTEKLTESIQTLMDHSKSLELSLIPAVIAGRLKQLRHHFSILEDRDQHDYIYDLEAIAELQGKNYKKKRNLAHTFEKKYGADSVFSLLTLSDKHVQKEIFSLVGRWQQNKKGPLNEDELIGLRNVFQLYKHVFGTGIYHNKELVAFAIVENLHNQHAMIHYEKTDHNLTGVTEYLMKKTAEHLTNTGYRYLNFQQDLGEQNLRAAKTLWRPMKFLLKYRVIRKDYQGSDL